MGAVMRPNVTEEEARDPDYVQQSLVPMRSETHSGTGKYNGEKCHGSRKRSSVFVKRRLTLASKTMKKV